MARICAQLDTDVAIWRTRPLEHIAFPYVFLDATYRKVRINQRVVSQAVVIATGVSADGRREVLDGVTGDIETEAFWTDFLRDLRDRGLTEFDPTSRPGEADLRVLRHRAGPTDELCLAFQGHRRRFLEID